MHPKKYGPHGELFFFSLKKEPMVLGALVTEWISPGPTSSKEWAGSEDASSLEYYEHNVGNLAVKVVGQHWSSEVNSLFLEDWEIGRVALSCHLSVDLLCQEMRDACGAGSESPLWSVCLEGNEGEGT